MGAGPRALLRLLLALLFLLSVAFAQRLEPGDRIRVVCEQEPTISVERVLSPAGYVSLPLLGRVNLGGLTVGEAEVALQQIAAVKLKTDRVLISVTRMAPEFGPIEFTGAVKRSGSVPYRPGITLGDIAKLAEPTVAAATEAVEISEADGNRLVIDLSARGGATKLRPGDRVFFPQGRGVSTVLILGSVVNPGTRPFQEGMSLRKLVESAGGTTGHAQTGKVRIERRGRPVRIVDLDTADAGTPLERGDTVIVPAAENGRFITLSGFVALPGLVEYRDGMTLTAAIKAAGGLGPLAGDFVLVKRAGSWKRQFDYSKILSKQEGDIILEAGDMIEVTAAKVQKAAPPKPRKGPVVPPR